MPKRKQKNKSLATLRNKVMGDKLIVILGPTATGKTKLAIKLAKLFNGEIISADSRQVYKGMDIGTGKDLEEYKEQRAESKEQRTVPYHLINIINPKKQFSLAEYQKFSYQAIDDIIKRGKTPFLVGGTGLYIQAIVDGYKLADVKPNLKLRAILNKKTLTKLQKLTKKYKIQLNQSDFYNKRRLVRAIEIIRQRTKNKEQRTKSKEQSLPQPLGHELASRLRSRRPEPCRVGEAEWAKPRRANNPKYDCLLLGLTPPREQLHKKIEKRLKKEFKDGLIGEVKKLKKQGLSWKKLEAFGLEYRFIAQYLQGQLTYEEMFNKLLVALWQFAKRQMTWFKRDKKIIWLKNETETIKLIQNFLRL